MTDTSRTRARGVALDYPHHDLTGVIIGAALTVHNVFGFGFLERVYRRSLVVELQHLGIACRREVTFDLYHRGVAVGLYRADLIVEAKVIVEIKTGLLLDPAVVPQTLNYLRASGLSVGLVVYFGPSLRVKRVTNFAPSKRPSSRKPDGHR